MPRFELSKWYADCVTDDGAAFILYSAALRWRGPTIHYTSLLAHRSGHPTRTRVSLRRQPSPLATEPSSTIALFIEGLLGSQKSVEQSTGVTCQNDPGLDGSHASGS